MKVVKQNLSDVLYIADTWIQADRRRVAERVREACVKACIEFADQQEHDRPDFSISEVAGYCAVEIRALDIDKLLGEE